MESGYYAALTGLVAKYEALNVTANNFANIGTTGYKAQEDFYRTYTAAMGSQNLGPLNLAINNYGVMGGATTNLAPGPLQSTGNPLDIALQGKGFLVVKTSAGDRYTRNGSLRLNAKGILTTQNGDEVMGLIPKPKGKPGEGPIKINSGTIAIGPGGLISVDGAIAGQLKIVDFAKGTRLTLEGNSYYNAPAEAETPAASPQVKQGALESSNVNPMNEMVSLILLQRQAQMLQSAISTFDKTFDESAIANIPVVQ
ncbi:MAG: flagellar hook basal-body protein [Acidobacteriota bacterium]|nr:flagellar hook basal-body protein [Acidobacteriota bacterium]